MWAHTVFAAEVPLETCKAFCESCVHSRKELVQAGVGGLMVCWLQAVEAMLQCFCEDCERNDGSAMHPYYMPAAFKKVILDAEKQRGGSRLFGAMKQIARAMHHALSRAVEPIQYALVRIVIRWKDRSQPSGYRSVKQQPTQTSK